MIYILIGLLGFFVFSFGGEIGVKSPVMRNLPKEYRGIFQTFFVENFDNAEKFKKGKRYLYELKPYLSSVAGNYNLCLDIYKNEKLFKMLCFSASDGQDLSDKIFKISEEIDFLKIKNKPVKKSIYLKVLTISKKFEKRLKVTSPNGDILIDYLPAQKFKGQNFEHITVGNAIINIDTVLLNTAEASKVFDYLLKGYRFKGILIIKSY
ncbi:hypothetical protein SAMN06265182_1566 [Persephonella hydrogeniphila]|uniref:Uncharacterized protein n=1 Tax=Persephonella hydrogeniphila TaxID=198703 RepID=A0A285NJX4_9AQUI|nr:hypothetical protein [Persephonella hydrogeniphila]SNZ09558.1 hypothetical protein SAMN06265182_1566 [Persephonella hydrogeniphila]